MAWGRKKIESGNLRSNNIFESADRENNFEVEKVGRENSVTWNHKDSNSIHIDPNHFNSNKTIPDNLTNIGSINDSDNISAI